MTRRGRIYNFGKDAIVERTQYTDLPVVRQTLQITTITGGISNATSHHDEALRWIILDTETLQLSINSSDSQFVTESVSMRLSTSNEKNPYVTEGPSQSDEYALAPQSVNVYSLPMSDVAFQYSGSNAPYIWCKITGKVVKRPILNYCLLTYDNKEMRVYSVSNAQTDFEIAISEVSDINVTTANISFSTVYDPLCWLNAGSSNVTVTSIQFADDSEVLSTENTTPHTITAANTGIDEYATFSANSISVTDLVPETTYNGATIIARNALGVEFTANVTFAEPAVFPYVTAVEVEGSVQNPATGHDASLMSIVTDAETLALTVSNAIDNVSVDTVHICLSESNVTNPFTSDQAQKTQEYQMSLVGQTYTKDMAAVTFSGTHTYIWCKVAGTIVSSPFTNYFVVSSSGVTMRAYDSSGFQITATVSEKKPTTAKITFNTILDALQWMLPDGVSSTSASVTSIKFILQNASYSAENTSTHSLAVASASVSQSANVTSTAILMSSLVPETTYTGAAITIKNALGSTFNTTLTFASPQTLPASNKSLNMSTVTNGQFFLGTGSTGITLTGRSFSVCFWMYITSYAYRNIIYQHVGEGAFGESMHASFIDGTNLMINHFEPGSQLIANTNIQLNTWTHICVTWQLNSTPGYTRRTVYANGVSKGTNEGPNLLMPSQTTVHILGTWTKNCTQSYIDNYAIVNKCLTAQEVQDVYGGGYVTDLTTLPATSGNLLALYTFNGDYQDKSGNGRNVAPQGGFTPTYSEAIAPPMP